MVLRRRHHPRRNYLYAQTTDRKPMLRINHLIADIQRNGRRGTDKPETLKYALHGYWSRRVTVEHRLVYTIVDDAFRIAQCRLHYS